MDLRQLTPDLAVSPQIMPHEVPALAAAGFKVLVNNRPDAETAPDHDSHTMRAAAEAAGMQYHEIPFTPGRITPDMIADYEVAISGAKPVIAYCRSGNRSTTLWALTQAGRLPEAEIVETALRAGYDLTPVRPLIASLAGNRR
ncbi:MAG: TIGR01244 family sulfur transferase [Paracoccus sp. (in: a-proteobacteria)]|uniref:TIGR01244 family sulfur transferase n=1 Tax=Paracoccus sp. TaxID=267 RepID=UPI0026E104A3|nr:TIGR01244 family sulfur transferase [Paracoccus sp. (in: a-proteobacteria)]MDO5612214.1 TIGR01244 family sulfur transferase [Paracoccus sp. (in: a-proteobacteria)]